MVKIKKLGYTILLLLSCVGLLVSLSNCTDDDPDDIMVQNFLEKNDGTKWVVTEDDIIVYLRINNNLNRAVELWMKEINMGKGMTDDDCYYYSHDLFDNDEMEIGENSTNKFSFTYLGNETWVLSLEGDQLKLIVERPGERKGNL